MALGTNVEHKLWQFVVPFEVKGEIQENMMSHFCLSPTFPVLAVYDVLCSCTYFLSMSDDTVVFQC